MRVMCDQKLDPSEKIPKILEAMSWLGECKSFLGVLVET